MACVGDRGRLEHLKHQIGITLRVEWYSNETFQHSLPYAFLLHTLMWACQLNSVGVRMAPTHKDTQIPWARALCSLRAELRAPVVSFTFALFWK